MVSESSVKGKGRWTYAPARKRTSDLRPVRTADVMHAPLLIKRADRLGPNELAAALPTPGGKIRTYRSARSCSLPSRRRCLFLQRCGRLCGRDSATPPGEPIRSD